MINFTQKLPISFSLTAYRLAPGSHGFLIGPRGFSYGLLVGALDGPSFSSDIPTSLLVQRFHEQSFWSTPVSELSEIKVYDCEWCLNNTDVPTACADWVSVTSVRAVESSCASANQGSDTQTPRARLWGCHLSIDRSSRILFSGQWTTGRWTLKILNVSNRLPPQQFKVQHMGLTLKVPWSIPVSGTHEPNKNNCKTRASITKPCRTRRPTLHP